MRENNYFNLVSILSLIFLLNGCSSKSSNEVKEENGQFYLFSPEGTLLSGSLILVKKGKLYIDGHFIIDNKGQNVYDFLGMNNGLLVIASKKGEGIMSLDGEIIVEPKYAYIKFDYDVIIPYSKKDKAMAVRVSDKKKLCDDIYSKIVVLSPDAVFGTLDNGRAELWINGKKRVKASEGPYNYYYIDIDRKVYGILSGRKTFLFNLDDL